MKLSKCLFRSSRTVIFICSLFTVQDITAQGRPKIEFSVDSTYEYTYQDFMVEGGEGFKLYTKVYLPKGEGPWPVVMSRTPYAWGDNKGDNNFLGREYAKRGLGFVVQYCRGKGGSEGFYRPNEFERVDGLAMVNWLASQSWCKSIGIFGASYVGFTGWIIADEIPEKVKGLYLHHYGVDRHISVYKDGLFRQDILTGWAIDNASEEIKKPVRDREEPYYNEYKYMPQIHMDVDLLGAKLTWYRDWIIYTNYEDPYWNQGYWAQLKSNPVKIKVPVTVVAGLYDHHMEGTILGYERLNDDIKKQSRLILGAWNHSYQTTPTQHNPKHDRDIDPNVDQFEWLFSVLAKGVVPKGEVNVYFIEEDKWFTFDSWPIKNDGAETYYFTKQKDAVNPKAYKLSEKAPEKPDEIKFVYDPKKPVISNGGETLFNSAGKRGSQLQEEIGYRDDVVSFVTPTLTENLVIAGKISVTLNVGSDADDTCFGYKVSEVMPDGSTYNIRSGITTLAYRNNPLGGRQAYTPGEIVEIKIETLPITWNVKAGNKIRIDITSSNFPEYSIHSNYSGIWSFQTKTRVANQVIYVGGEYNGFVSFPTKKINRDIGTFNSRE